VVLPVFECNYVLGSHDGVSQFHVVTVRAGPVVAHRSGPLDSDLPSRVLELRYGPVGQKERRDRNRARKSEEMEALSYAVRAFIASNVNISNRTSRPTRG
jgi:hypothetical protein